MKYPVPFQLNDPVYITLLRKLLPGFLLLQLTGIAFPFIPYMLDQIAHFFRGELFNNSLIRI